MATAASARLGHTRATRLVSIIAPRPHQSNASCQHYRASATPEQRVLSASSCFSHTRAARSRVRLEQHVALEQRWLKSISMIRPLERPSGRTSSWVGAESEDIQNSHRRYVEINALSSMKNIKSGFIICENHCEISFLDGLHRK